MRILNIAIGALLIGAATTASAASQLDADRAARGEAKLAKMLEGRVAGAPVDCLQQYQIRSSRVIENTAIVYEVGRTLYVNRPDIGASSLNWDPILLTDTRTNQLCSIDIVRLIDRTTPYFERGFVGLGKFVPYKKVDSAAR